MAARRRREQFLSVLDHEEAALDRAVACLEDERTLPEIPDAPADAPFDRIVDPHVETVAIESRALSILDTRQECIQTRAPRVVRLPESSSTMLCEYLFASIDETYPVQAAMTAVLSELRTVRRALGRSIAHHPG